MRISDWSSDVCSSDLLRFGQRIEHLAAGEEGIAVRALDALDALLGQHLVEQPAGAAVAVEHENAFVAAAGAADALAHAHGNLRGRVWPGRLQAAHRPGLPVVPTEQLNDHPRQRPATDP